MSDECLSVCLIPPPFSIHPLLLRLRFLLFLLALTQLHDLILLERLRRYLIMCFASRIQSPPGRVGVWLADSATSASAERKSSGGHSRGTKPGEEPFGRAPRRRTQKNRIYQGVTLNCLDIIVDHESRRHRPLQTQLEDVTAHAQTTRKHESEIGALET